MSNFLDKVRPDDIMRVWGAAAPFIRLALDEGEGESTERDVFTAIVRGAMHLWLAKDGNEIKGALVTEFSAYDRKRALILRYAGGQDLDDYLPFLPEIEEWGRKNDCQLCEVFGREGWRRKLKDRGYAPRVLMRKTL